MLTDYKSSIRMREIENIIMAQASAAKKGDAFSFLRLSKLLQKRLYQLNDFSFETSTEQTNEPPQTSHYNIDDFGT